MLKLKQQKLDLASEPDKTSTIKQYDLTKHQIQNLDRISASMTQPNIIITLASSTTRVESFKSIRDDLSLFLGGVGGTLIIKSRICKQQK